jgi:hypothetical protein
VNWCQFWFEYFPLPPVNVLAMVENVLMEHDPELLVFLTNKNVSTELYAWPILKTAFSEILTATAWKAFWDHVLTNEPAFLLCGVVAYNVLQRTALLSLKDQRQFKCFYDTHHPVDVKKLLSKTYHILRETSEAIHPRQYLHTFEKITPGEYPNFCDYPKTVVEMKSRKSDVLKEEMASLKTDEIDLFRKRLVSLDKLQDWEVQEEEKKRILEMENAIRKQLLDEQERVQTYYERVAALRQKFLEEDKVLASLKTKIAKEQQLESRRKYLSSLLEDVKFKKRDKDYALTKVEDQLLSQYSELLKNKYKIERLLRQDYLPTSTKISDEPSVLDKQQEVLAEEIDYARQSDKSQEQLTVLNLATGLAAMDELIGKVQMELEKEREGSVDSSAADKRVVQLRAETRELASEVNNLIRLLAELRSMELGG